MHLVLKFWFGGRFVAEKQTYVLNLMAGHLLNMTYNENGKWNVWELDHYTDRSSLGIHFWDLYWKMAYLKFETFWYSNVRPWETVQIWGDCPPNCASAAKSRSDSHVQTRDLNTTNARACNEVKRGHSQNWASWNVTGHDRTFLRALSAAGQLWLFFLSSIYFKQQEIGFNLLLTLAGNMLRCKSVSCHLFA